MKPIETNNFQKSLKMQVSKAPVGRVVQTDKELFFRVLGYLWEMADSNRRPHACKELGLTGFRSDSQYLTVASARLAVFLQFHFIDIHIITL